ncbi:MAG: hypothetical protein RRX92_03315 [Lachnospiraceae bacterium]
MKKLAYTKRTEQILELLFYLTVFAAIAAFAILQPFNDPPDEINRFKVAQYICVHGVLPHGADPEIGIGGYGASYAFQPILPYIIQGYVMRLFFQFTQNYYILTYVARFVNVIFGVLMAIVVRKTSKELFKQPQIQWLFTILVVLLPQNLFLHSYVNSDSLAALSSAIILYACILGIKDHWRIPTCITLSIGIILCALSYYNAYGVILCSILIFLYSYSKHATGKRTYDFRAFFRTASFISALVLLGIGWWFIRNAILYEGDFLGMTARSQCAIATALPEFNPLNKPTIRNSGYSILFLLFQTQFASKVLDSSIAMFGSMILPTYDYVYTGYKIIFVSSLLCLFLPKKNRILSNSADYLQEVSKPLKTGWNIILFATMLIPIGLCIWYCYAWDYQPQGRYILPLLIPFMYFITVGFAKLQHFFRERFSSEAFFYKLGCSIPYVIILFVLIALASTMLGVVIPHYQDMPNWLDQTIQSLSLHQ